jgi:hypothetical protein
VISGEFYIHTGAKTMVYMDCNISDQVVLQKLSRPQQQVIHSVPFTSTLTLTSCSISAICNDMYQLPTSVQNVQQLLRKPEEFANILSASTST